MYQVYLMEFPYKKSQSSIEPNPKQRIVVFDEVAEGRFWGYELALDKWCMITMLPEHVNDMLAQERAIRLL